MIAMFWISAFLDLPAGDLEAALTHWERVTGYRRSAWRGEHGEFATLVPPAGDDHLRVQRLDDGAPRIHLDLHVDDVAAAVADAEAHGARVMADHGSYVVMASPGGFTYCFVPHPHTTPPPPAAWPSDAPGGLHSVVDQVCLDIPAASWDDECAFWQAVTGWELRDSADHAEFRRLVRPEGQPLQILLQRLDQPDGPVRAHLDLATDDRHAETCRHVDLGAEVLHVRSGWTVLADPAGSPYCITDRHPDIRVPDQRAGG